MKPIRLRIPRSTLRLGTGIVIEIGFYALALLTPQLRVRQGNSDFLAQYTAGQMLLNSQGRDLYNLELQKQTQGRILATLDSDVAFKGGLLPFIHPPFVALAYFPLADLSYLAALLTWTVGSLICFTIGVWNLARYYELNEEPDFELVMVLCAVFLPVVATVLQGQITSVAFVCLVLTFLEFKRGREFRAGIWLSLVLVKFQVLPVPLFVLLVKRRWRALLGFLAGGSPLVLISLLVVGTQGCWTYLKLLSEMPTWVDLYGLSPAIAQCIRGQMFQLFHGWWPGLVVPLTILFDVVLVIILLRFWRDEWNPNGHLFDVKFAVMIIVAVLVAPHVNFHDLAFLLLPALVLYSHTGRRGLALQQNRVRLALFLLAFPIQLLTFVSSPGFPIQINVVALVVLGGLSVGAVHSKVRSMSVAPGS
jgi:Glycosyltransferase family 87